MNEEARNWVKAKGECTPKKLFAKLVTELGKDVKRFNALDKEIIGKRRFLLESQGETVCQIFRAQEVRAGEFYDTNRTELHKLQESRDDPNHIVKVYINEGAIIADHGDPKNMNIEITHDWNPETLSCDYFINKKPTTLTKISQQILDKFMFDGIAC